MYGGVALRLERDSSEIGLCCKDTSGWFRSIDTLSNVIDEHDMKDKIIDISDSSWICIDQSCGPCSTTIIKERGMSSFDQGRSLTENQIPKLFSLLRSNVEGESIKALKVVKSKSETKHPQSRWECEMGGSFQKDI